VGPRKKLGLDALPIIIIELSGIRTHASLNTRLVFQSLGHGCPVQLLGWLSGKNEQLARRKSQAQTPEKSMAVVKAPSSRTSSPSSDKVSLLAKE